MARGRRKSVTRTTAAIYVAKFAAAVYVLHAFQKKTQKTSKKDIEIATKRYKLVGA
ncbi:MAG: type II toxin-antitoxin system RelE/ParE family toxin [Pseudomonadales bacterium]|nr:type II toxin-antitoxin system RelE/ParE family toxin [Pseudomonadales bacterium]